MPRNRLSGPITYWLAATRAGVQGGAEELFAECRRVLVPAARGKLRRRRSLYEAEDVVQSCLGQFAWKVRRDGCPGIADREGLWAFLRQSLDNKIVEYHRRECRAKRGGGRGHLPLNDEDLADAAWLGPAERVSLADLVGRLMAILPSDDHRDVARLILIEGHPYDDVALALGCAPSTVHRRRLRVQELWKENLAEILAIE